MDHSNSRRSRRKRSASKPTTPLNRLRGVLGEHEDWSKLHSALDSVKNDGSKAVFEHLVNMSRQMSPLTSVVIPATKPVKKLALLQAVTPLDTIGLYQEVAWVVAILNSTSDLVNSFVARRNRYVKQFFLGQYKAASDILDGINNDCGFSLWAIENQISLLAFSEGFEKQKAFVSNVISSNKRSFVSFFSSFVGERNESRVSIDNFKNRFFEKSKSWNIKSDHLKYLSFKLLGADSINLIEAADILSFEASSSLIDLYTSLIEVLALVVSDPYLDRSRIVHELIKLEIDDHCLNNLKVLYLQDSDNFPDIVFPDFIQTFLASEFELSAKFVSIYLRENPDTPQAIILASKLIALGFPVDFYGNNTIEKLANQLTRVITHCDESGEESQSLERFAVNFRYMPISSSIGKILNETGLSILSESTILTSLYSQFYGLENHLSLLTTSNGNLFLKKYINLDWGLCGDYYYLACLGEKYSSGVDLSKEATAYAGLKFSRSVEMPVDVSIFLNSLSQSCFDYYKKEELVLRAWFLLESGDIYDCVSHCVKVAILNKSLMRALPINVLFEKRGFRDLKELQSEPALSIGFYLYIHMNRKNDKDVALKVSWKQFLKVNDLQSPSELREKYSNFNSLEIVYFLRYVCTQDTMELSSAFNSPLDLDNERLKICILLSEIDPERTNEYKDEIIELTRRLSIETGIMQVESSRVYADVIGIQRWCYQNLNEKFLRYLDYSEAGLAYSIAEVEKDIENILKSSGVEVQLYNYLDNYDVTADTLLVELIEECANCFLMLPRFGLDAYLGSRMRHGSLEGAFRSQLENRNLITKINSATGQYNENDYWLNSIRLDEDSRKKLTKALSTFSESVDTFLIGVINRIIHVRSDDRPEGIISLWHNNPVTKRRALKAWLLSVKAVLSKNVTIEQFVEFCVTNFFWPQLEESLADASGYVMQSLCNEILKYLSNLLVEVQKLPSNCTNGLVSSINVAKSDINAAAEKVSNWFTSPQLSFDDSAYSLKTSIEIGVNSLKHLKSHFNGELEWIIDEKANVILHSSAFHTINDVAFLILGNIHDHSGYFDDFKQDQPNPKILVCLRWKDPNIIEVEFQNQISSSKDISIIAANVRAAKEKISRREFDSVSKQNKKTGLVRLASTLNYEGSTDRVVDFGLFNDTYFKVTFAVPVYFLTGQSG